MEPFASSPSILGFPSLRLVELQGFEGRFTLGRLVLCNILIIGTKDTK